MSNQIVDLSQLTDDEEENELPLIFHFLNIGNPVPKPSPKVQAVWITPKKGGKMFRKTWTRNPAQKEMVAFSDAVKEQAGRQGLITFPVFPEGTLAVKVWFCRRPNNTYFINGDRQRPKSQLIEKDIVMKPDTDNLLKFLLDSFSKVIWKDDNQVVKIIAYKCLDNVAPYEGRTIVEVTSKFEKEGFPGWAADGGSSVSNL